MPEGRNPICKSDEVSAFCATNGQQLEIRNYLSRAFDEWNSIFYQL